MKNNKKSHLSLLLLAIISASFWLTAAVPVYAATVKCPDGKEFTVPSTLDTADRAHLCDDNKGPSDAAKNIVFCGSKSQNTEDCPSLGGKGKECGGGVGSDKKNFDSVKIWLNIGCRGAPCNCNPIIDMVESLLRFLSVLVGLVLVGSAIVAGIQFSASGDEPQAKAKAIKRITAVAGSFFLYIMIFALIQWLVPGGLF